jgi:hypothetical protein
MESTITTTIENEAKYYSIIESENSFSFQNQFNMYIELNKNNGNLKMTNLTDNATTQKLFKALFNRAIQLKKSTK